MRTTGFDKQKDAIVQDKVPSKVDGPSHFPKQTTDAVKETGAKVPSAVTETAWGVAAPVNAKTQEPLDAAKRLIGERRLQKMPSPS